MDGFRTIAIALLVAVTATAMPTPALAQTFPTKAIRFIAGGAGSPADMRVRQVAEKLKLNPHPSSRLNKELVPITRLTSGSPILAVNPSIPAASLQEFIDLAKARPGALSYAASSQGSVMIDLRNSLRISART